MADDPRLAAAAAAILPWVVMPTGGGRYSGADWTPEEQAAYDGAGGWGAGIDAARRARAEQAARDALAALDGPDCWEWGVRDPDGTLIFHGPCDGKTEKDARLYAYVSDVVVRRRPAGPWEPAPAPADPTSEEPQP